ncbi:hypothetical protein JK364_00335 [Streptomyces sp. 110]|uniref:Uncharacterized protein n=1 Tax=Streptomyces endocoffeicus TaxID=2898945 RepID=A0ABS1PER4_9ACTN|nr:hypothetical protein [Streptomyces endocoffeicus]MBL1110869.1 hypothetical protein [Streptomyces endocoffeicus]
MTLSPEQNATLLELAAALIPAGEREPAADAVLADGIWLGRAFAAEPSLVSAVARACDQARGLDPHNALRRLTEEHPADAQALTTLLSGAYYMVPQVREAIGYPGQVPRPASLTEAVDDLDEELIGPMLASGPRYRPTPDAGAAAPV